MKAYLTNGTKSPTRGVDLVCEPSKEFPGMERLETQKGEGATYTVVVHNRKRYVLVVSDEELPWWQIATQICEGDAEPMVYYLPAPDKMEALTLWSMLECNEAIDCVMGRNFYTEWSLGTIERI